MSKTHSLPLNRIYLIELIGLSLILVCVVSVVISKVIVLTKDTKSPPSINIQQLQLQQALNAIKLE